MDKRGLESANRRVRLPDPLLRNREQEGRIRIPGLIVHDPPKRGDGLLVRTCLDVKPSERELEPGVRYAFAPSLLETGNRARSVLRRDVTGAQLPPLLDQRGVDGSENAVGFPIGRIPLERRFRGLHRVERTILAGVQSRKLGIQLRGGRVELDRALVRGDRVLNLPFRFEMPAEEEVVSGCAVGLLLPDIGTGGRRRGGDQASKQCGPHLTDYNSPSLGSPAYSLTGCAMPVDPELLEILACPNCKTKVDLVKNGTALKCAQCKRVYPIKDDIPVMLIDEATIEQ